MEVTQSNGAVHDTHEGIWWWDYTVKKLWRNTRIWQESLYYVCMTCRPNSTSQMSFTQTPQVDLWMKRHLYNSVVSTTRPRVGDETLDGVITCFRVSWHLKCISNQSRDTKGGLHTHMVGRHSLFSICATCTVCFYNLQIIYVNVWTHYETSHHFWLW